MSAAVRDVYVERLTLTVGGRELLSETPLRLMSGRCYALLGENGVGKSSLLHRISRGQVPGWPRHISVGLVAQEEAHAPPADMSAIDWLLARVNAAFDMREEHAKITGTAVDSVETASSVLRALTATVA